MDGEILFDINRDAWVVRFSRGMQSVSVDLDLTDEQRERLALAIKTLRESAPA